MKRTLNAAITVALIGVLTACGDNDESNPISGAESSTTSSSVPTEPTEPAETQTSPPWEAAYTPKQLHAYEAALQRFESYEQRSEPIWAEGRATPTAEALFREYFPSPQWQLLFQRLEDYEQVEVVAEGTPTVHWSRPRSITKDGLSVEIQQCVDYSAVRVTQYGKTVESRSNGARFRTIHLAKPEGYGWLIYQLIDATSKPRPKRCDH